MSRIQDLAEKEILLDKKIKELIYTGREYGIAYSNYRIELAKELLRLKDEGYPVTLASDLARGKPEIAKLKEEEISKEAIYKANQESINAIKLDMKLMDGEIQREWYSAKD